MEKDDDEEQKKTHSQVKRTQEKGLVGITRHAIVTPCLCRAHRGAVIRKKNIVKIKNSANRDHVVTRS